MARPSHELIRVLRATAARLAQSSSYRWSDFACCNCGHLVQSVTQLSPREIYEAAFARGGDWGEQAREFCASSGYPIDYVFARLFELGLSADDVKNLERLSDDRVLRELGVSALRYTRREDVLSYLDAWARLLERELEARGCAREQDNDVLCEAAE